MSTDRIHQFAPSLTSLARTGKVYDLSTGWWTGMPLPSAHPAFQVQTYRTPHGMRLERSNSDENEHNYGFISEIVSTSMHAGTHMDARCHVTAGPDDSWFGGHSANEYLGDFGALREDAAEFPPFIMRAVVLDAAAALDLVELPDGFAVDSALLAKACAQQGVTPQHGDAVFIRTGMMREWPDVQRMTRSAQPGLSLDGAMWLQRQWQPTIVGADNMSVEVSPATGHGEPQPVHRHLLHDHGTFLLEWVYLEDLVAAHVSEFLLICLPLQIAGATGSLVRPIAII